MSVTHQGVFVQTPQIAPLAFTNGDGVSKKTLITGGADGTKVVSINAATTDTAAKTAQLYLTRSSVDYLIGSVSIPASSGNDGSTASVSIFPNTLILGIPIDNDGQKYLFLASTADSLRLAFTSTLTSGKECDFVAVAGNF